MFAKTVRLRCFECGDIGDKKFVQLGSSGDTQWESSQELESGVKESQSSDTMEPELLRSVLNTTVTSTPTPNINVNTCFDADVITYNMASTRHGVCTKPGTTASISVTLTATQALITALKMSLTLLKEEQEEKPKSINTMRLRNSAKMKDTVVELRTGGGGKED